MSKKIEDLIIANSKLDGVGEVAEHTNKNLINCIEQQKKCESEKRQRNSITEDLLSQIETVAIENSMRTMERRNDRKHNLMVFGHWKDKCSYFDEVDVLQQYNMLVCDAKYMTWKSGSKSSTGRWRRGEHSACSGQETHEIQEPCLIC